MSGVKEPQPPKKVVRHSSGLVDALFDSIDRLNAKEITPEESRAISHTARSIVSVAALELDMQKFRADQGNKTSAEFTSLTFKPMKG